ncbi:ankyrin repeat-containing domain protein, partial [Baffinella frigidus]
SGRTALHIAAKMGKFEAVCALCACSNDATFLEHQNREGLTALQIAVRAQDVRIVRFLLAHGASATTSDMTQVTALHDAVQLGSVGIIDSLLAHGADMHVRDSSSFTP